MARNRKPVSGPGKLSARTDQLPQGADASRGQPVRSFPAEFHGQRQQLASLQQAAPLDAGGGAAPGTAPPPGAAPLSAFRGTERPGEPITAGIPFGPGEGPPVEGGDLDYFQMLQVMNDMAPHPALARLLTVPPSQTRDL
jgi:hypothetical protein